MKEYKVIMKIFNFVIFYLFIIITFSGCGLDQKSSDKLIKPKEINDTTEQNKTSKEEREQARQQTIRNLKEAIKGETTASAKYLAFSKKAKEEGLNNIAKLFEATSKSESIHQNNHIAALKELGETPDNITPEYEVKSTKENLSDAINGESYESNTMYPDFIKTSMKAKTNIATISFNFALKTEEKHKKMFENALNALNSGIENTIASVYYVCPTCGNLYDSFNVPERCSISMTSRENFIEIK